MMIGRTLLRYYTLMYAFRLHLFNCLTSSWGKAEDFAGFRTSHWGLKARFARRAFWIDAGDCSVNEEARVEAEFVENL